MRMEGAREGARDVHMRSCLAKEHRLQLASRRGR